MGVTLFSFFFCCELTNLSLHDFSFSVQPAPADPLGQAHVEVHVEHGAVGTLHHRGANAGEVRKLFLFSPTLQEGRAVGGVGDVDDLL